MENTSLPEWDCLLPLEMLYRGVIFKNHNFRKEELRKEGANNTYN